MDVGHFGGGVLLVNHSRRNTSSLDAIADKRSTTTEQSGVASQVQEAA